MPRQFNAETVRELEALETERKAPRQFMELTTLKAWRLAAIESFWDHAQERLVQEGWGMRKAYSQAVSETMPTGADENWCPIVLTLLTA